MTQTLKKEAFEFGDIEEYYKKFYKSQHKLKSIVINHLFRNISFITSKDKIRAITESEYEEISNDLHIPKILVHKFISKFLIRLLKMRKFIQINPGVLHTEDREKLINLFLKRYHRLAPIFDYQRAKINASILKKKLKILCFWPQLMTQLAIIVFITDHLDKNQKEKLKQADIRALFNCSAYAFHRTRNKIGLTPNYLKNMLI
jgi:hypothetical protein